jgi:hypothetical protein
MRSTEASSHEAPASPAVPSPDSAVSASRALGAGDAWDGVEGVGSENERAENRGDGWPSLALALSSPGILGKVMEFRWYVIESEAGPGNGV